MKAGVYHTNSKVEVVDLEKPKISDDEILVKAAFCGICGSDVMEWYRIKKAPLVLGHEMVGTIEEVGKNVSGYEKGQRVFVSHHVPCNDCYHCSSGHHTACETLHKTNFYPGGFAEYIRVPKINIDNDAIVVLPDNMTFEQGTFIEPLACVVRGQRLLDIKENQTVAVIGCGISGLMHIKLLQNQNVKNIVGIDIDEYRLEKAKEFGAHHVISASEDISEEIKKMNKGRLADIVIVCTGAESAAKSALEIAGKGATILFFAVPKPEVPLNVPINDFWRNEVSIKTSYGAAPDDLKESLELISNNVKVDDMITHVLPLDKIQEGFNLVANAKDSMKVLINLNSLS